MEACDSRNTKLLGLRFRALLNEGGAQQIELAKAYEKGSRAPYCGTAPS
jgi:hypothetical protein